ncbi:amino acid/amide ABC transporter ATP-binding protein 2, HAAT family [Gemmobacter megaterium]|uniref:Amino acid/amide ABC transporter ATP-binding protein 2, HAAT family n=1 Tax=Gemmobacter megaterium TaxID=1086013 RepID=A0A1N7PSY5_9RHOB|nr:ABC transporter ATP-binding protein [Gemmobacter megaterium]GGE21164.1 ABC transporter ATP-binding protein [Gemmobacter megaterium]SIT13721.1 amino acid/amide ABC transporter ATP-binding protein 2, HAAT family [Gemmobacter megaterium]
MSDPLLSLRAVKTDIAQYHILHGVDLDVPRGQVTMLLGRNGAGKTTTLRTIIGLWQPHSGDILLDGENIARQPPATIARKGVALVPEDMGIFANLTVEENMTLAAVAGPIDQGRLDWIFSVFPPLRTFWKNPAGNLSGGQKQMLSTARAMIEERRLYLIDEPSKGLAPAIVSTLARALRDLKLAGATILMVEQNFKLAKALGDHAAVMDDGRIIWSGAMAELASDASLQERLMGLSMEHA